MVIKSLDRDYIATIEMDSGEISRWYLHRIDKVEPRESSQITWSEIIGAIDLEIARIGWSINVAKKYVMDKFGK